MCRALKVLCAAPHGERLKELKLATVSVRWELVGGAPSIQDLEKQVEEWRPDVVVLDASLGDGAVQIARRAGPAVRVVSLGSLPGADAEAGSPADVRSAILGLPGPGGPVRR